MIFTIVIVLTIISLVGCVCIKKPVLKMGLGILVALGVQYHYRVDSYNDSGITEGIVISE